MTITHQELMQASGRAARWTRQRARIEERMRRQRRAELSRHAAIAMQKLGVSADEARQAFERFARTLREALPSNHPALKATRRNR